jgi:hypothetical protein
MPIPTSFVGVDIHHVHPDGDRLSLELGVAEGVWNSPAFCFHEFNEVQNEARINLGTRHTSSLSEERLLSVGLDV